MDQYILTLVDQWLDNLQDNTDTAGYDLVDHRILLQKSTQIYIEMYLVEKRQQEHLDGAISDWPTIN